MGDQRIEKRLIGVLKIAHETVFFDGRCQARQPVAPAQALLLQIADVRREQTVQGECVPFALGKGGAFVEPGIVEKGRPVIVILIIIAPVQVQVSGLVSTSLERGH